ncbi:MAG: pantothenate kinase [Defluviitaleaceae bacterium]|nr:pantothenate kinase [Defluviitaleaceae bacterium]
MKITLGIDIGSTSTKIIGLNPKGEIAAKCQAATSDRLISMYGSLGKLLHEKGLSLDNIERIALTGAGASWIEEGSAIYGIKTVKISETDAVGLGALALSGLFEGIIMNIGTGTVFVYANAKKFSHVGGSGVGGATLVGLSKRLIGESGVQKISQLAQKGNLKNIDLMMGDVYNMDFSFLPPEATAANFGNFKTDATKEDMAQGLLSTIYQILGVMAAFAALGKGCKTIIVTGALAELVQAKQVLPLVGGLYGVNFIFCENAVYATALGAAFGIIKANS